MLKSRPLYTGDHIANLSLCSQGSRNIDHGNFSPPAFDLMFLALDASSRVHLRSSFQQIPHLHAQHPLASTPGSTCKSVWYPHLVGDTEGPTFILFTARHMFKERFINIVSSGHTKSCPKSKNPNQSLPTTHPPRRIFHSHPT